MGEARAAALEADGVTPLGSRFASTMPLSCQPPPETQATARDACAAAHVTPSAVPRRLYIFWEQQANLRQYILQVSPHF